MEEYGELVVLGYSSYRVAGRDDPSPHSAKWQPVGSPNCHFRLAPKKTGNGLTRRRAFLATGLGEKASSADAAKAQLHAPSSQFVTIPLSLRTMAMVEYVPDASLDMFQIGRQPSRYNDFSVPGPLYGASGTISRFAARLVCERDAPYRCRLYAGGFDASHTAAVPASALKYCAACSTWTKALSCCHVVSPSSMLPSTGPVLAEIKCDGSVPVDALTKNGVRLWVPEQQEWFEVSMNGFLYAIQGGGESSSSTSFHRPTAGPVHLESLVSHGCIIDLGGVQLQFLTKLARRKPSLAPPPLQPSLLAQLESLHVQCPVQLMPLRFHSNCASSETAHVFPACGHVFGYDARIALGKACPMCRTPGGMVLLKLTSGNGAKLHQADERNCVPDCVFNPCGHAVGLKCATQYASIRMPNGKSICPICAVALDSNQPYSKLFWHTDDDDDDDAYTDVAAA
ncbi:hypothetical protein SDRG_07615 [Saprolegnia diclina VS20]|uniref:RING-type domain-containing protein n=1 Tax=Saprolegnia diclina (strain VS20) TaxID=1156394 RepID=T0QLW9_SAPDV|nr:hypothetical protein SDRG_07615 [Saprolegnia diclina VS20]EQC34810.1 hypothetical protein SDRG_07615 [Saprolegnia diclina VS20]|eukprot:XP_008611682.1 hypothetical protein SDRG_07615 [Saprolegnia diclina VS20]